VGSSHAVNWQTRSGTVACGVAQVYGSAADPATGVQLDGRWPGLQCSAPRIPRVSHGIGDPFVQLGQGAAGRARLVDLSQDDLVSGRPPGRLAPGSTWARYGIVCHISASAVSCDNGAGHGFTLSPGHVRLY